MMAQVTETGWGWKPWSAVVLASVALHGLLLGGALLWSRELPPPRRVVPVEAICLTAGSGQAGGGAGQVSAVKPRATPQPPPPQPQPVKKKPKPKAKLRRVRPAPPRPEIEPPPALALPRPAAVKAVRPGPLAAVPPGRGSGPGAGVGRGQGAGRGSGPGTNPGSGSGSGTALKSYLAQVRRLLEQHKTYPWMARRQHREGVVVLKFTIGKNGAIAGQAIARSSGHEVLDEAAQQTLHKVGRFPPLPATLGRSHLTIQVPLSFRLAES
jgi:protein TonB